MLISTYLVEAIEMEHHPIVSREEWVARNASSKDKKRGKMRKLTLHGWGILMLSLASFCNLAAQEVVAHIRGTVTDPSGAGVPGAVVKATNTQTQVSTTVMTKEDGSYEFLSLAPGKYEVRVTKTGFRTSTAQNIPL